MRTHISKQQFEAASRTAARFRDIIRDRDEKIQKKTIDEQFALPSFIWQQQTELFSYCFDPSYEVVDTWRLHMMLFTGNYIGFALPDDAPLPRQMRLRYERFTAGLPDRFIFRAPEICAERGYRVNGGIVNKDMLMYQAHLAALYRSGALAYLGKLKNIRILEIGGGYGGLAYALKNIFPDAHYVMVDLPESLLFAGVYLNIVMPQYCDERSSAGFEFVSNHLAHEALANSHFDLIINTGSLGEMTDYQVGAYAKLIERVLAPHGLFYEENGGVNVHTTPFFEKKFKRMKAYLLPKYLWFFSDEVGRSVASLAPPAPRRSFTLFAMDTASTLKAWLRARILSWTR